MTAVPDDERASVQGPRWRLPRRIGLKGAMLAVAAAGGLLGLVVVPFWRYGEHWDEVICENNLKQLYFAIELYRIPHGEYPRGTVPNPALEPDERLSWVVSITPGLDWDFNGLIDESKAWNAGRNGAEFRWLDLRTLRCPEHRAPGAGRLAPTWYVGIGGLGVDAPELPRGHERAGIFGYDRATTVGDVTDGLGATMMLAETSEPRGSWIQGGPATVRGLDPSRQPYLGPGRPFGGNHRGVTAVLFADGSVRMIGKSVDPRVFEAFSTIAGGEAVEAE